MIFTKSAGFGGSIVLPIACLLAQLSAASIAWGENPETLDVAGGIFNQPTIAPAAPNSMEPADTADTPQGGSPAARSESAATAGNSSRPDDPAIIDGAIAELDQGSGSEAIDPGNDDRFNSATLEMLAVVKGSLDPYQLTVVEQSVAPAASARHRTKASDRRTTEAINELKSAGLNFERDTRRKLLESQESEVTQLDSVGAPAVQQGISAGNSDPPGPTQSDPEPQAGPRAALSAELPEDRAVVSLILNGRSDRYIGPFINQLLSLRKNRGITIGNVVLVGLSDRHEIENVARLNGICIDTAGPCGSKEKKHRRPSPRTKPEIVQPLEAKMIFGLGFHESGFINAKELLQRYSIAYSPTWIIRSKGIDYLFEGRTTIAALFSDTGEFVIPAEPAVADRGTEKPMALPVEAADSPAGKPPLEPGVPVIRFEPVKTNEDLKAGKFPELLFGG